MGGRCLKAERPTLREVASPPPPVADGVSPPSMPHVPEALNLGPLVSALLSKKLDGILAEEERLWDETSSLFGKVQCPQEIEQDVSVHEKVKVHNQFLARLEMHLDEVSRQTRLTAAEIADILQESNDISASEIVERLLKYTDYHEFEALMKTRYWASVKEVRLFWDIENVGFEEMEQNGPQVIQSLQDFLRARDITGFAAQMWAVAPLKRFADNPRVVGDLSDGAIRAVNCKSKPEAADHVIKSEIDKAVMMYMKYQVPPSTILFVLITSDQDFTDVLQKLKHFGFKTVLIHNARKGTRHVEMMSLYADEALEWKEMLPPDLAPLVAAPVAKSSWGKLLNWAKVQVKPAVWVDFQGDRLSLSFKGSKPETILLSKGEQLQNRASERALQVLARVLGDDFEAKPIEQSDLRSALGTL